MDSTDTDGDGILNSGGIKITSVNRVLLVSCSPYEYDGVMEKPTFIDLRNS